MEHLRLRISGISDGGFTLETGRKLKPPSETGNLWGINEAQSTSISLLLRFSLWPVNTLSRHLSLYSLL
eukprot:m.135811 g.135811  ORF g.135811 m.135811 type:complete len:69 (+) comp38169_c0_seq3:421-627(+)